MPDPLGLDPQDQAVAPAQVRVEQVRLELNRALECGQRVSGQAEATEDEAEAIVGRGQCGILADGILVGRARRGQIVLALRGESLLIQSFGGGSARSLRSTTPWRATAC